MASPTYVVPSALINSLQCLSPRFLFGFSPRQRSFRAGVVTTALPAVQPERLDSGSLAISSTGWEVTYPASAGLPK